MELPEYEDEPDGPVSSHAYEYEDVPPDVEALRVIDWPKSRLVAEGEIDGTGSELIVKVQVAEKYVGSLATPFATPTLNEIVPEDDGVQE